MGYWATPLSACWSKLILVPKSCLKKSLKGLTLPTFCTLCKSSYHLSGPYQPKCDLSHFETFGQLDEESQRVQTHNLLLQRTGNSEERVGVTTVNVQYSITGTIYPSSSPEGYRTLEVSPVLYIITIYYIIYIIDWSGSYTLHSACRVVSSNPGWHMGVTLKMRHGVVV